ncbi:uncharacterized protein HD556DRAFT_1448639 [Suillus plorans]|uniref:Uncharacterized protein n=1 Tax=Suillus plorans TaxID=116603 RepID=A0A9P7DCT4_9AGAM|nr:uncharacterized protein HD556DRAFT_1448639 [Suillus plorans]KAG1787624.1 hypothetical protein HD556DRAFT_1448639 [Suillus plorans]
MFTSRITILMLLTFLAGANAGCATCPQSLDVDGIAIYELVTSYVKTENGFTECSYVDKMGNVVTCEYTVRDFWMLSSSSFSFDTLDGHQDGGELKSGDEKCPKISRKDDYGC